MTTTSASQQAAAMGQVVEDLEQQMMQASADPGAFAKLSQRRDAAAKELVRLQMRERVEAREADEAHRQALEDRRTSAAADASRIRARGLALDAEIKTAIEHLQALLAEGVQLTKAHSALAGQSNAAINALLKGYRIRHKPEISNAWASPGEATILAIWELAHRAMGWGGIPPESPKAWSVVQTMRR